jgi:hypothetical protein
VDEVVHAVRVIVAVRIEMIRKSIEGSFLMLSRVIDDRLHRRYRG